MSVEKDYILEDDFLDKGICDYLVRYFEKTILAHPVPNVNPVFDNRVVYYETVEDAQVKLILKNVHDQEADIYPEATHLVKWPTGTSLGSHADNTYEDGMPNYVHWRTHSAVVYLNEDFTGGSFYFQKEWPMTIKPEKGKLVAFTGGLQHVHGVCEVESGTRYTLPMWFTKDKSRAYPVSSRV